MHECDRTSNYLKKNKSLFAELVKYQSNYIKELNKKLMLGLFLTKTY